MKITDRSYTRQDEDGNFVHEVLGAQERSRLESDYTFTINNLPPGRRFRILLNPVSNSGEQFTDKRRTAKAVIEVAIAHQFF